MMKKIISLLTVALMAVCFAACTKDTATLRGLIEQENSKCPMNLGSAGEVLSIGYDDENRLVQITVHVNDDTRDLESIREDTQLACRICALTLLGKKAREFMREIVDTGSDVEITYRSRNSDKSVVAVLSHSDLGDYVDNQQDTVDDSLDEVDSAVKAMQGSIPYEIDEGITIHYETAEGAGEVVAEKLLMSVGRRPVMKGYGLENLPLERNARGGIIVDEQMRSSIPGVYVCGDLTGFSLLAHTAVREGEVAVHTILGKEDKMSYRAIPGVVYTNPEIAGVGETEESLRKKEISYRAVKLPMAYSGRFVAENEGVNGVCKLLIADDNTILGAHVFGTPASEIIALAGMAIELKLTTEEWKRIVIPHPTVGEIFREAL